MSTEDNMCYACDGEIESLDEMATCPVCRLMVHAQCIVEHLDACSACRDEMGDEVLVGRYPPPVT